MGGALFTHATATHPALHVPGLPPPLYFTLKANLTTTLLQHFTHVSTPHEAPEKPNHGDIDFLVCEPTTNPSPTVLSGQHATILHTALHAVRSEATGSRQRSFAVPVPELDETSVNEDGAEAGKHAYAQVDLTVCASKPRLDWLMLTHSYGDLFQILGVQLRPLGLTFLPDAFVARVHPHVFSISSTPEETAGEVEYNHPKRLLELPLSSDPAAVLSFLGLDKGKWETGFNSLDEIFAFIAAGRFFDRRTFEYASESPAYSDDENAPPSNVSEQKTANTGTSKKRMSEEWTTRQKSRDKRRKRLRPMYRHFLEEWLPAHPEVGRQGSESEGVDGEGLYETRTRVLDEALDFFEKRAEYDDLVARLKEKQDEETFWSEVRRRVPLTGERLGCAMRGLKSWVGFEVREVWLISQGSGGGEGGKTVRVLERPPVIRSKPVKKGGKQPVWTRESGSGRQELLAWVDSHWSECKKLERQREKRAEEERRVAKERLQRKG